MPAVDHIHQLAPGGTSVIYSDMDPVTVAYAQDIIGDNPSLRYVHCDAGKPEELLNSGVVEELFGNDRKLAIGMNGVLYLHLRPLEKTLELIKPWKVDEPGVMLLEKWVEMEAKVTEMVKESWGSGAMNGVILKK